MKEPDKWCIKVTSENKEAIEKWRTTKVALNCHGYCVNKNSFDDPSIGYWYPNKPRGYTEISFEEFKVYTSKPLKQAVHCTTQEEWDFVLEKLNYKFYYPFNAGYHDTIDFINLIESFKSYYKDYQILSFQEWCDLNGHKMEKEVKFETGKWYSIETAFNWIIKFKEIKDGAIIADWSCLNDKYGKVKRGGQWESKPTEIKELSIEEIQQYLPDDHPDKIKSNQEFKVGDWVVVLEEDEFYPYSEKCPQKLTKIKEYGLPYRLLSRDGHTNTYEKIRHATEEEMQEYFRKNEYLLKKKIEAETYEYFNEILDRMEEETSKPSYHLLSIDDEELPMVNIIKTNTIKQLLNND